MKNLKNYYIIVLISVFTSIIFFACTKENIENNETIENSTKESIVSNKTGAMDCWITGSTVSNPHTSSASSTVSAGSTVTYQYNSLPTATNIQWVVYSGSGISFIGCTTCPTVTVSFSSSFTGGSIKALGTDSTGQNCNPILPIIKANGGGDCPCPNPVIRTNLTNEGAPITNTHPYYRLELQNLQSGDTYVWSSLNAQFMGGVNNTYVIVKPLVPVNGIFEVYCTVTRVCPNGTIKRRKALYRNFLGGTHSTAYTGFLNTGNVCDIAGND